MTAINVRNLKDDLSFGSRVDGVNWETLADDAVRAEINRVFEERGMIVFENVEPTSAMQVALSKVFGPLKDHPTKTDAARQRQRGSGARRDRYALQAER